MGTVLGVGNCQVNGLTRSASALLGMQPMFISRKAMKENPEILAKTVPKADVVFARGENFKAVERLAGSGGRAAPPVIFVPRLHFSGFHPDVATPLKSAGKFELPMGNANSAILLAAWREGLSEAHALTLFRDEVYDALGYYDAFSLASDLLIDECRHVGLEIQPLMRRWMKDAPFFYVPLHPKMIVLTDIALTLLERSGIHVAPDAAPTPDDGLARNVVWPVYPEIAERLGIAGDYIFRPRKIGGENRDSSPMDLETFVERTYAGYRLSPPDLSTFPRMADPRYQSIGRLVKRRSAGPSNNPYAKLPANNWWSKAVAEPPFDEVDPGRKGKFKIDRDDKIATAGSCFAQHIARRLEQAGFNYFVAEPGPASSADAAAEGYGTFSARFGNIYTVRQLLQLADRAFGKFKPKIDVWELAGGEGYLDPFRPRIGSKPFASIEALRMDRGQHFAAVREMFEACDIFVFTLGLTECWWSREDQAVVPLPPGIVGAETLAEAYEPKNFSVTEVLADLQRLVDFLREVNPAARIVLTVSPVPLIATFENDHVLNATTYSKSVLRVAAGEVAKHNDQVAYFPSYEIITGSYTRGRYFADDLRQVTPAGVDHVMTSFLRHYAGQSAETAWSASSTQFRSEVAAEMEIVCDEEELEASTAVSRAPR